MKNKYIVVLLIATVLSISGYFVYQSLNRVPEKKILYYQSGMHPWIKSDKPGKCPICGMDLQPVYEREEAQGQRPKAKGNEIHLNQNQLKHLNVQTETVKYQLLRKEIRTVGTVAYDPELVVAEEEFVAALESGFLQESGRRKLRLLGLSEEQINQLAKTKRIDTNLILPEKNMWVYADVYEQDLDWVRVGRQVIVKSVAFPEKTFYGQVKAIEPVLDARTRSAKIRIIVNNQQLKLKPQMQVDVYLKSLAKKLLAVPKAAVLDTGQRKVAYVEKTAGVYEARDVVIGAASSGFIPVVKGLSAGEKVVTSANFLIDSQSQLTGGSSALYGGAKEVGSNGHNH